jgi:cytokinin riboside 5'-monophosphate phosphoribohydrolase
VELRSLGVYCSSAEGAPEWLVSEAVAVGRGIAARGLQLVYGGASVGVMGKLADAALDGGAKVVGVIPKALVGREAAHMRVTELKVVDSMHDRKAEMFRLADAFVFLPGGFGTIAEFFEMLTWKQLGIHGKPIVFVNLRGYYDPLLSQFERGIAEGLISSQCRILYAIADNAEKVFTLLEEATVLNRVPGKWY